ncbi:MAG: gliding motility-associated C-terminal domain-containing protein [Flavobacteriales bacterium]
MSTLRTYSISLAISALCIGANAQSPFTATAGTEFWAGFMQNAYGSQTLTLTISAQNPATGTVSIPLTGWSTNFNVTANGIAQVVVPNTAEHIGSEVITNKGVHIVSSADIAVTATSYQNFTTDAMQLLPVSSLGTTYRAEAYRGLPGFAEFYKSELLVVATQDGTQVRITPSVLTSGGQPANVPFTINLNAGQSYQVQSASSSLDLTGTLVEGTAQSGPCRPFAVFSGSMCANVPVGCPACDHICEQMVPTERWGTAFHTVPIPGTTQHTYRVLAHQNGTQVTIDGGAPITLNAGAQYQVNAQATGVCITTNQPVSVAQVMEGFNCANKGDPSMVEVMPDDRKSTWVKWRTVTSPQITQHAVGIILETADIAGLTLDGAAVNASVFQTYPNCPGHSFAMINVGVGDHVIQAPGGFLAYASGTGTGESYALPISHIAAPPVSTPPVLCATDPVTLTAPLAMVNIAWTTASNPGTVLATTNSYTFTPTVNDTYIVTGELPISGCPQQYEWEVGVPAPLTLDLLADGQTTIDLCQYQGVQLQAVPAPDPAVFDLTWTPAGSLSDPTIPDPVAYPTTDTWYKLHVESPVGCGEVSDSIFVNVLPSDLVGVTVQIADAQICAGESTTVTARAERVHAADALNGATGPLWASIQGGALSTVCGSVSGDALRFDGAGTRRAVTGPLNMVNGANLRFALRIASGAAPCDDAEPGDDVLIEYSLDGSTWSALSTLNEASYPNWSTVVVAVPAVAQTASTRFRWSQVNNSGAGTDIWAIDDVLITRYDNSGLSITWNPGTGLTDAAAFSTQASPTSTTTYQATVTNASGCSVNASNTIQVAAAFDLSVTPNTTVCTPGTAVPLVATPSSGSGVQYTWGPATALSTTNAANTVATPGTTITYTVSATTDIGCTDQAQVTITVGQLQGIDVSASDVQLCQGEQSQLTAVTAGALPFTIAWAPNNGSLNTTSGANVTASPTATTTYTATATETASGCQLSDVITINMSPAYSVNAGPDDTICTTLGHVLNVVHNVPSPTILWSNGGLLNDDDIQSPTIMFDTTATYTVTVTDVFGCSASDAVTITDPFDLLITPINVSACAGTPQVLDAQFPGLDYLWNTGATTQTIAVTTNGTYVCTITDPQGCQAIKTYFVTFNALPVIDLGPDTALCGLSSYVLNAGAPGSSYLWSTQQTTQAITVTASGTYTVTATTPQGCSASDVVHLDFFSLPTNALSDVTTCITSPPTLDAGNPGGTYSWNTASTAQAITADTSGTYMVTVTNSDGCSATFSAVVMLMPEVIINLGPDTTLCAGTPLVLDAAIPGLNYSWSTGASTQQLAVNSSDTYSVSATNGYCSGSDAVQVTFNPLPTDVLTDRIDCVGEPITLDAGNAGSTYLWNTGATAQQIVVTSAGTYSATITNVFGCSITADANAAFSSYPVVELGRDTVLCEGDVLTLDAGTDGSQYLWNTGATTRTINVTSPGSYIVALGNGYCTSLDTITAAFNPRPDPMVTQTYFACLTDDPHYVVIDAGNASSSHQWNTGETEQYILAAAYGWYFVSMTNQFDCARTDSAEVREFCPPSIYVPNTFTPNGDGVNDVWFVNGKNIGSFELNVFDRWGGVIFHSEDVSMGWDGTINGEPAKNDIYVWRMSYKFIERTDGTLGFEHNQLGHVTVLR